MAKPDQPYPAALGATICRTLSPDLIRFALGSGLPVGEICAVRCMDLDLDLDGMPVVTNTCRCAPSAPSDVLGIEPLARGVTRAPASGPWRRVPS